MEEDNTISPENYIANVPKDYQRFLDDILQIAVDDNASDVHISANHYPTLRVSGRLVALQKKGLVTPEDARGVTDIMMNDIQKEKFNKNYEVDFSYSYKNLARFRVNVFIQRGEIACAMRLIPRNISTLEELGMPSVLYNFCESNQGFVLVTGPTGQGKSTTLAALINQINKNRFCNIITIEDPIEYIFESDRAIINQREIGHDVLSFSSALKSVFRQDPDVIMVGEMRDPETISMAITAAETGHLVFSTLHTNSASQTINRIIDSFPAAQQSQIRAQLSSSLKGVISQRLVPRIRGGLTVAYEIMIANAATSNLIRESKIHELEIVIETSGEEGMISLNKSLYNLIKKGEISIKSALSYSSSPNELRRMIR